MNSNKDKIFIDTSGFFSLVAENDRHHLQAINIWNKFQEEKKYLLYTSEYVISETLTLTQSKISKKDSIKLGEYLLKSSFLNIIHVDRILWDDSWEIYKKYADKDFSFIDCISFILMETNHIKKAFAFDKHFTQYGFELIK